MDEVAGYVPPTAAPPAKKPILTILKQGRAFGLGLVLSTQNPVDLDYKAMSNAGTWLVGRLQTENDKARVLEGLRSAAGGADIRRLDAAIGGLQKRQFMLVSAKDPPPKRVRDALGDVVPPRPADQGAGAEAEGHAPRPACRLRPRPPPRPRPRPAGRSAREPTRRRSRLPSPPGVTVSYLDPAAPWASQVGATAGVTKPARVRRDARRAALRRHGGSCRRAAGVRGAVRARSTAASTSTPRRSSTSTTATSARTRPPARPTSSPPRPIGEREVLRQTRRRTCRRGSSPTARSRSSATSS